MGLTNKIVCLACGFSNSERYCSSRSYHYVKCTHCGLVFLKKFPSPKELDKIYSYHGVEGVSKANIVLHASSKIPILRKLMHLQGSLINKGRADSVSKFTPRGKVLDVGCGPGTFLKEMKTRGWDVYGTEMGDKLVEQARKSFGKTRIFKGGVEKAGIGEKKFDVVTLWHVLEHIPNTQEALLKIKRIIKRRGYLVIEVPHAQSLSFSWLRHNWTLLMAPQHLHIWSRDALYHILQSHGFKIVKIEYPLDFPFILFSSLAKVNRLFMILAPLTIIFSFAWSFATSLFKRGDAIRIYCIKNPTNSLCAADLSH